MNTVTSARLPVEPLTTIGGVFGALLALDGLRNMLSNGADKRQI